MTCNCETSLGQLEWGKEGLFIYRLHIEPNITGGAMVYFSGDHADRSLALRGNCLNDGGDRLVPAELVQVTFE